MVEVSSEDSSACSAVASGARVSSSVVRGLLSVWSGLGTSTVIDCVAPGSKLHQNSFHPRSSVGISGNCLKRRDARYTETDSAGWKRTILQRSCCTWIPHTATLLKDIGSDGRSQSIPYRVIRHSGAAIRRRHSGAAILSRHSALSAVEGQNLCICLVLLKGTGLPVPYTLHLNCGFSR